MIKYVKIEDVEVGDMLQTRSMNKHYYKVTAVHDNHVDVTHTETGEVHTNVNPQGTFRILIKGKIDSWKEVMNKCGKTLL